MQDKRCSADGCKGPGKTRGLCPKHYMAWWRAQTRPTEPLVCEVCGASYVPQRYFKSGRNKFCSRACKTKAGNASTSERSAAALRAYYKRRYNLTMAEVEEFRNRPCAICGTTEWNGRHKQAHIDHCHKTGKVRGLLCSECNTGLGKFRDDPQLLESAIRYLRS